MSLSPLLLSLVACPVDHGPLTLVAGGLLNERLRRLYPIVDEVPVLLEKEARSVTVDEMAAMLANR